MRVFVTGMGGELGTRVAALLDAAPFVDEVAGVDREPPRRRLQRARFRLVEPLDRRRMVAAVRDFDPTAVVHCGVYEPNARSSPRAAAARTEAATVAALGAAAQCRSLDRIVVRSGIE
ncbi:MAG TPA: NAD-dependent epimerase/dehydratase family protein, partial [Acidimicrobiales bacterium]